MRLLTLLCCALLVAGCGDEEGPASYIATTIDGVEWRGMVEEAQPVYTVTGNWVSAVGFRKVSGGGQLFYLNLPFPPSVGSWALGTDTAFASWMACPDQDLDCIYYPAVESDPGVLTITAIEPNSGRIQGTFSFTGYALGDTLNPTKSFTNGTFDIRAPAAFRLE